MSFLDSIYALVACLPFEALQAGFMQQAFVGLVLLAPMTAAMGVQVVNFRMAFFSDAISHSAFAGVALGLIFSVSPDWTMPLLGLVVGLGIVALQRRSRLSSDTVIGVFFAAVMAFGLAIVSRERNVARDIQTFLYGDILTIDSGQIMLLFGLFLVLGLFLLAGYNRLMYTGLNPVLARAHEVRTAFWQYFYAGFLALVVMFSVRAVGVFLVTALLVIPAASARNLARSAKAMFWWAIVFGLVSSIAGLLISAEQWARTATGATIVLVSCLFFALSLVFNLFSTETNSD